MTLITLMINAKTKICGIIGNPVEHSLSPAMHNAGYEALGLNFAYVAFPVTDVENAVKGIRGLNIRGASVTIPHKIAVMRYLDAIDEKAQTMGAVNTIVNNGGKLTGYNTDYEGAVRALKEVTELAGKKVLVVGSGGAARGIVYGLTWEKAAITIVNRTREKAETLAKETGAKIGDFDNWQILRDFDVVINTTSVGMTPNVNDSIIPKEYLEKNQIVFDVVYNPKDTKLIKDAKEKGCTIIYGYKMLLYQAVAQFEMFTGSKAPVGVMEKKLV